MPIIRVGGHLHRVVGRVAYGALPGQPPKLATPVLPSGPEGRPLVNYTLDTPSREGSACSHVLTVLIVVEFDGSSRAVLCPHPGDLFPGLIMFPDGSPPSAGRRLPASPGYRRAVSRGSKSSTRQSLEPGSDIQPVRSHFAGLSGHGDR